MLIFAKANIINIYFQNIILINSIFSNYNSINLNSYIIYYIFSEYY